MIFGAMKHRLFIVGLRYALDSYMSSHAEALLPFFHVECVAIEEIVPHFNRRSILSLWFELFYFGNYFNHRQHSVIVSVGPKVGLLNVLFCFGKSTQSIHWMTGQAWCLSKFRFFNPAYILDVILLLLASHIFVDSPTQLEFLLSATYSFFSSKVSAGCHGSIGYVPDKYFQSGKAKIMSADGMANPSKPLRVGFLGRIALDKGIGTILRLSEDPRLAGDFQFFVRGPMDTSIGSVSSGISTTHNPLALQLCNSSVNFVEGYCDSISFLSEIDILLMPSLREGFCSVCIEAQALALPVVCSDIYGLVDSVGRGRGGIMCTTYDDFVSALLLLLNPIFYKAKAYNAFVHAKKFSRSSFLPELSNMYHIALSP